MQVWVVFLSYYDHEAFLENGPLVGCLLVSLLGVDSPKWEFITISLLRSCCFWSDNWSSEKNSICCWISNLQLKIIFILPMEFEVSSIQFSHLLVSDPLGPMDSRTPGFSVHSGAFSNSGSSSQWCHPTLSSSAIPFSSSLQSFPASGSFQMSLFFTSSGQSIRVSASASVLPMNIWIDFL